MTAHVSSESRSRALEYAHHDADPGDQSADPGDHGEPIRAITNAAIFAVTMARYAQQTPTVQVFGNRRRSPKTDLPASISDGHRRPGARGSGYAMAIVLVAINAHGAMVITEGAWNAISQRPP